MVELDTRGSRVPGRLQSLDVVRLIAALMVVGFHWTFNGIVNGKVTSVTLSPVTEVTRYGFWGVTLFFLISGFVIGNSAQGKTPRQYLTSRLTRLFPAFWAAVVITGTVSLIVAQPGMQVSVGEILVNFTMIPSVFHVPFVDGAYWTLEYELVFYGIVLIAVAINRARNLTTVALAWVALAFVVEFAAPDLPGAFLLERPFPAFATGVIIATIVARGPSVLLGVGLLLGAATTVHSEVAYGELLENLSGQQYRGVVVMALVLGFHAVLLIQAVPWVRTITIPGSRAAGDLTYPVYLLHAHLGYMAINAFATDNNRIVVYPAILAFILVLAWVLHQVVEVRLHSRWRHLFDRWVARPIDSAIAGLDQRVASGRGQP